ncbi:MAG: FMN-binding protein [Candidatus Eisenbacteria bacterium]|nr:FMN-binding protein [Candidatus Eisenbacteria bacterium]
MTDEGGEMTASRPCFSRRRVGAAIGLLLLTVGSGEAKLLRSQEEALASVFPGCRIERLTVYPSEEQVAAASAAAGSPVRSSVVYPYVAWADSGLVGTAYFDTHIVRTLPEVLMIAVGPGGNLRRVEVLSFQEPPEYLPKAGWYAQFAGRVLDAELNLRRGIRPMTGATLSARSTVDAVRRVLALHRVLPATPGPGNVPGDGTKGEP